MSFSYILSQLVVLDLFSNRIPYHIAKTRELIPQPQFIEAVKVASRQRYRNGWFLGCFLFRHLSTKKLLCGACANKVFLQKNRGFTLGIFTISSSFFQLLPWNFQPGPMFTLRTLNNNFNGNGHLTKTPT
jgi:hypothetical protein